MQCPSCHHAFDAGATSCGSCGAPFALAEEPAPAALDLDLDLALDPAPPPSPRSAALARELDDVGPAAPGVPRAPARSAAPSRPGSPTATPVPPYRVPRVHAPPPAAAPRPEQVERWRRAAAWAVDAAVVALVSVPAVALAATGASIPGALASATPHLLALAALVAFTYGFVAEAVLGATAGHALLGLRVVAPDGSRPGLDRVAVRAAVAVAGVVPLGAGLAVGLVSRDGRALHDRAAETRVVRRAVS